MRKPGLDKHVCMAEAAGVSVLLMCVGEGHRVRMYTASPDPDAGHIRPHCFAVNLVTQNS